MSRPLLGLPKKPLVDLCRREGWPFVEDPSNTDPRFARARWRRIMPQLAAEGLSAARLARLSARALRVEEALDVKAREAFERARSGRGQDLALEGLRSRRRALRDRRPRRRPGADRPAGRRGSRPPGAHRRSDGAAARGGSRRPAAAPDARRGSSDARSRRANSGLRPNRPAAGAVIPLSVMMPQHTPHSLGKGGGHA